MRPDAPAGGGAPAAALGPETLRAIVEHVASPGAALVLLGSYARGDAGPHSDVDVARLLPDASRPDGDGSRLVDGRLVVVSSHTPEEVDAAFTRPERAAWAVAGWRSARHLAGPASRSAAVRARAHAFTWDAGLERRADAWVADQMVGWAEEVGKGLEGLRRHHVGRLAQARYGMAWGLSRVMVVHARLLLDGDNDMHDALTRTLGASSPWVVLRDVVFGVEEARAAPGAMALEVQVQAGLRLYRLTAESVGPVLHGPQREIVEAAAARIAEVLGG